MKNRKLIRLLKKGDEDALEFVIQTYAAYVSTVIANQLGGARDPALIEELSSDVFFSLWQNRLAISTTHLRGWLGAAARNRAKNYLRAQHIVYEALDEDLIVCSEDNLFDRLTEAEQNRVLCAALDRLKPAERETLVRYYFYNQTVTVIAAETNDNLETVKSRLSRSRRKLKAILDEGGYFK